MAARLGSGSSGLSKKETVDHADAVVVDHAVGGPLALHALVDLLAQVPVISSGGHSVGVKAIRVKLVIQAEAGGAEPQAIVERANRDSPVANSLRHELPNLVYTDVC